MNFIVDEKPVFCLAIEKISWSTGVSTQVLTVTPSKLPLLTKADFVYLSMRMTMIVLGSVAVKA